MPSEQVHDVLTALTTPLAFGAGCVLTPDMPLLGGTGAAAMHLLSGTVLSPDLDITTDRWGPLGFLWWPYMLAVPHRHWVSHGLLVGPLLRVLYLALILGLLTLGVFALLGQTAAWLDALHWLWGVAHIYRHYAPPALCGLILGGAVHSIADWTTSSITQAVNEHMHREHIGGPFMQYAKYIIGFCIAAVLTAWLAWESSPAGSSAVMAAPLAPASLGFSLTTVDWWQWIKVAAAISLISAFLLVPLWILSYPIRAIANHRIKAKEALRPYPSGLTNLTLNNSRSTSYAPKEGSVPAWLGNALLQANGGIAPTIDVLDAPRLPELVRLADIRGDTAPGRLALGMTVGNKLITAAPGDMYHALFHGQTRSGKTNSVNSVFTQLHHMAAQGMPLQLYAGDRKGEFAATWDTSPLFPEGIQVQTPEIADMLEGILNDPEMGLLARNRLFKRTRAETGRLVPNIDAYEAVTGERIPRMFIFVDELNALMLEAGKNDRLSSALMQILQMGASAGYYLLGGAQHLKDSVLGTEGKNQFVTRAHYGNANPNAIGMLFGKVDLAQLQPYLDGSIKGRGLLSTAGGDNPAPFQALLCTEQDILGAIAAAQRPQFVPHQPAPATTTEHHQHQEHLDAEARPHEQAVGDGVASVLVLGSVKDERKAIIQRMHAHGMSQNQIIGTVFGIKKGSNPTYFAAREEVREALKELEDASV